MAAPQVVARPHQEVRQIASARELWANNDGTIEVVLPFGQHGVRLPLYSSANGGTSRAMQKEKRGQWDRQSVNRYAGKWLRYETGGSDPWAMVFKSENEARNMLVSDHRSPAFIGAPAPSQARRRPRHRHGNRQHGAGQQRRDAGRFSSIFDNLLCFHFNDRR